MAQRDEMKEQQRLRKEGIALDVDRDTDPDGGVNDGDVDVDQEPEDDLFGSDDPMPGMAMHIG